MVKVGEQEELSKKKILECKENLKRIREEKVWSYSLILFLLGQQIKNGTHIFGLFNGIPQRFQKILEYPCSFSFCTR